MTEKIWVKYEKIKEIVNKNPRIKSYLERIEPLVKEIKPRDKDDYYSISQRLETLKNEVKIYDIIEENETFYIVIENNEETNEKLEKLLLSEEMDIKKEGKVEGHGSPVKKDEILKLFQLEKSMCKIKSKTKANENITGSGFFCKLNNFPIKYALFTNNHVLDESNIEIGKKITFEYLQHKKNLLFNSSDKYIKKEIKIIEKRRVYTRKELDYTCIELFESDGIKDFFEIDPDLFKYDNNTLKNKDIFILKFPSGEDLSFSYGTIRSLKDNKIIHNASTEGGSSGSPIIIRSDDNYVIGFHYAGRRKEKDKTKYSFNLGNCFMSILNDIKSQIFEQTKENEINCIYTLNENEDKIKLLNDFSEDISKWDEKDKKLFLKAKQLNKDLFKENIEIFINGKKIDFVFAYEKKELKKIKVK